MVCFFMTHKTHSPQPRTLDATQKLRCISTSDTERVEVLLTPIPSTKPLFLLDTQTTLATSRQSRTASHRLQGAKKNLPAVAGLIATTPNSKIDVRTENERTSQKLIATKTPLSVRRTFACDGLRLCTYKPWSKKGGIPTRMTA